MKLFVVSDGRRGIENQALGLAEAVARQSGRACDIAVHTVSHRPGFAALPPSLQLTVRRDFGLPEADLVIGCGRQAHGTRRKGAQSSVLDVLAQLSLDSLVGGLRSCATDTPRASSANSARRLSRQARAIGGAGPQARRHSKHGVAREAKVVPPAGRHRAGGMFEPAPHGHGARPARRVGNARANGG